MINSNNTLTHLSDDDPDVRDRAFVYWRLLSLSPQAAKAVVISERPPVEEESSVSETLLDDLIHNIATLASVYHKPSSQFGGTMIQIQTSREEDAEFVIEDSGTPEELIGSAPAGTKKSTVGDLLDLDFGGGVEHASSSATISPAGSISTATTSIGLSPVLNTSAGGTSSMSAQSGKKGGLDDLLGLMGDSTTAVPTMGTALQGLAISSKPVVASTPSMGGLTGLGGFVQSSVTPQTGNMFSSSGSSPANSLVAPFVQPKVPFLTAVTAQGLDLSGAFVRR